MNKVLCCLLAVAAAVSPAFAQMDTVTVQAEDFSYKEAANIEIATYPNGEKIVGYLETGDVLRYNVDVSAGGVRVMEFRAAAAKETGKPVSSFDVVVNGKTAGTMDVNTGDWVEFRMLIFSQAIELASGSNVIELRFNAGVNIDYFLLIGTANPFSGSGTSADPYIINTAEELKYLADRVNAVGYMASYVAALAAKEMYNSRTEKRHFKLGGDIDLSSYNWTPIGYGSNSVKADHFYGVFDGDGKIIGGLRSTELAGLFFTCSSATIKNLGLTDVNIKSWTVGGIAASIRGNTVISNCYVTGNLEASGSSSEGIGGIVGGAISGSRISNCYSTATLKGRDNVGGIAGVLKDATITNSYATGAVSGGVNIGGLVGQLNSSSVTNSYAAGTVSGSSYIGGFVGDMDATSSISNSYSTAEVSGSYSNIGGFVGRLSGTVTNCYATGRVLADGDPSGGLVGARVGSGRAVSSYWDTQTTGFDVSAAGVGLSTAAMKAESSYEGWDFVSTWAIDANANGGYPTLRVDAPVSVKFRSAQVRNGANPLLPRVTVRGKTLTLTAVSAQSAYKIRLVDMRGKTVARFKAQGGGSFSLWGVSSGRYVVEVSGSGVRSRSAVVLR
jgi:hypothetical protein